MVIVLTSSSVVDRGFWYNGYRAHRVWWIMGSSIMVIVLTSSAVDRGFWYNSYRAHVECGRSWVLV